MVPTISGDLEMKKTCKNTLMLLSQTVHLQCDPPPYLNISQPPYHRKYTKYY